jgi:large subunit ribosomal protein L17
MRHRVAGRKFNRTANQRKALLRGLITSLFEHQRIETTLAKAKAIKGIAERLVTIGKRGDLHSKRIVMSYIPNRAVMSKLFSEIAPRFVDRNGGYLRIVQTRQRLKDRAPMAIVEFVDYNDIKAKELTKEDKKSE